MGVLARELGVDQWTEIMSAAVTALGPGLVEHEDWQSEVEKVTIQLARIVLSVSDEIVEATRSWEGTVVRVEDPAISRAGKELNLARIVFSSPSCPNPEDYAWVSRSDREGQALIARAKQLMQHGDWVSYTKQHVVQRKGGSVVRDAAGVIQTRAYLSNIRVVEEGRAGQSGAGAGTVGGNVPEPENEGNAATGDGGAWQADESDRTEQAGASLDERVPQTSNELLAFAAALGYKDDEVKRLTAKLCGPLRGTRRSPQELATVWEAVVSSSPSQTALSDSVNS